MHPCAAETALAAAGTVDLLVLPAADEPQLRWSAHAAGMLLWQQQATAPGVYTPRPPVESSASLSMVTLTPDLFASFMAAVCSISQFNQPIGVYVDIHVHGLSCG